MIPDQRVSNCQKILTLTIMNNIKKVRRLQIAKRKLIGNPKYLDNASPGCGTAQGQSLWNCIETSRPGDIKRQKKTASTGKTEGDFGF